MTLVEKSDLVTYLVGSLISSEQRIHMPSGEVRVYISAQLHRTGNLHQVRLDCFKTVEFPDDHAPLSMRNLLSFVTIHKIRCGGLTA